MSEIKKTIENLLKKEEIKIKPKWYFALNVLLVSFSVIFLVLFSALVFSILMFKNRSLPPHEIGQLIFNMQNIPVILLGLLVFISATILILYKKFGFVYRRPAVVVVGVLSIITLGASILIDHIMLHDRILHEAKIRNILYIRKVYENANNIDMDRSLPIEKRTDRKGDGSLKNNREDRQLFSR